MAALQRRRASDPVKSNVRIPAWAIARRLSGRLAVSPQGSPDSMAKRTVQTLPSEDDESLVLPRMEGAQAAAAGNSGSAVRLSATTTTGTSTSTLLLKMDVTGFRVEDLHLDVDTQTKKLCLSGMGPRMFKRSFPVPSYDQVDMTKLSASLVVEDVAGSKRGRSYLMIRAPPLGAAGMLMEEDNDDEGTVNSQGRRSIRIKDETRPPIMIEIPGP